MKRKRRLPFDPKVFLSKVNGGRAISDYRKDQIVYKPGDPSDSVFYVQSGKVKKTVVSEQGKEAVVGRALLAAVNRAGGSMASRKSLVPSRVPAFVHSPCELIDLSVNATQGLPLAYRECPLSGPTRNRPPSAGRSGRWVKYQNKHLRTLPHVSSGTEHRMLK
jgi:Cyclic nucleotide-binding domain